jgi:hypothetical protein
MSPGYNLLQFRRIEGDESVVIHRVWKDKQRHIQETLLRNCESKKQQLGWSWKPGLLHMCTNGCLYVTNVPDSKEILSHLCELHMYASTLICFETLTRLKYQGLNEVLISLDGQEDSKSACKLRTVCNRCSWRKFSFYSMNGNQERTQVLGKVARDRKKTLESERKQTSHGSRPRTSFYTFNAVH